MQYTVPLAIGLTIIVSIVVIIMTVMLTLDVKSRYFVPASLLMIIGLAFLSSFVLEEVEANALSQEKTHMLAVPINQTGETTITVAYSSWRSLPNPPPGFEEHHDFNKKGEKITHLKGQVSGPDTAIFLIPDNIKAALVQTAYPSGQDAYFFYSRNTPELRAGDF